MPSDVTYRGSAPQARTDAHLRTGGAVLLIVFMATMVLPVSVDVAGLRLTPLRILLLLTTVPLFVRLFTDPSIRVRAADVFIVLFCLWLGLTILMNNGMGRLAYVGISVIELLGGYLIGRVLIRSRQDFTLFMKVYLATMLFLFPFALVDMLTGRQILTELLNSVGSVTYRGPSSRPRWGLERVITGFEHPILFGLYNSLAVANSLYVWHDSVIRKYSRAIFATFMTFMSLSSGALLSAMIQFILVAWDLVTKGRWKPFLILFAALYIFLEFASNRGPILIFIETLTFNSGNAWTRVLQWEFGTAEVLRHPIFGMGLSFEWQRPSWLVNSIDNYWLVLAMRHGLPGVGFFLLATALTIRGIVKARNLSEPVARIRTGYMIGLVGMCFTLATVHVWGAVSVFVMVYLGAGAWIADATGTDEGDPGAQAAAPERSGPRYTRFAAGHATPHTADRNPSPSAPPSR